MLRYQSRSILAAWWDSSTTHGAIESDVRGEKGISIASDAANANDISVSCISNLGM